MLDLDSTSTLTARAGSSAITPLRYNYCPLPGRGRPITRLFNPLTTRVLALHTTCTALHYTATTTVPAYHPSLTLPSFITLRPRPASTPHSSSSSLHLSSHLDLEPTGHPSIRHARFASRLIFVVLNRIRRRYWRAARNLTCT